MTAEKPNADSDRLIEGLRRFIDYHNSLDVEVVCEDGEYRVQFTFPGKSNSLAGTPGTK
jgi:hypothetical protein